jgi:hypothetical protein
MMEIYDAISRVVGMIVVDVAVGLTVAWIIMKLLVWAKVLRP